MSYQDMPAFVRQLSTVADQSARAIEITVLTVARTHEIQNLRWSQLGLGHSQRDIIGAGVEPAAPGEMEGGPHSALVSEVAMKRGLASPCVHSALATTRAHHVEN
jgi:hypothetical protein